MSFSANWIWRELVAVLVITPAEIDWAVDRFADTLAEMAS